MSATSHLESLIAEYLDWQGYIVKRNQKVGKRVMGGHDMEMDVVGYHPTTNDLIHCEASLDAHSWLKREMRYKKKFDRGRQFIYSKLFPWIEPDTQLRRIAIFPSQSQNKVGGGDVISIDELMREIKDKVKETGLMAKGAIPESYPLLRTIQLSECGYNKAIKEKKRTISLIPSKTRSPS